jgi:hypothetical protein
MGVNVTIQNIDLLTKAINLLKTNEIDIGDGTVIPIKNILEHLVEVGLNIPARIRLQFQYPDDIGFVLYLTDFTKPDKQSDEDPRINFRNSVAAALRHHDAVPYMFPEKVLAITENKTWGWYLCLLPYRLALIPADQHPQDLNELKMLIQNMIS